MCEWMWLEIELSVCSEPIVLTAAILSFFNATGKTKNTPLTFGVGGMNN